MLDLNQVDQAAMLSLAHNPQTDPQQLIELAEWLKFEQGADSALPSTSFAYLTSQAPQGPLAVILERRTSPLLEALVANPNLPPMLALEFAADLPATFLANPALTRWLHHNPELFKRMEPLRCLQLLRHAAIPRDILAAIQSISPEIAQTTQLHIASNPKLDANCYADYQHSKQQVALPDATATILLQELIGLNAITEPMLGWLRQSPAEQHQALFNRVAATPQPIFEPQTLEFSPKYPSLLEAPLAERMQVAHSNDIKGLAILAEDDDVNIRRVVAQNPATPRSVHQLLELDDSQHVRAALARNPKISPQLLLTLVRDYTWSAVPIRLAAALNPAATPEILALLAQDQASLVRQTVGQNSQASAEILNHARQRALIEALYARDPWLHMLALGHPATPIEHLAKGIHSPWWLGRAALAENPGCPRDVLEQLTNDGNCYVQRLAQAQLDAR